MTAALRLAATTVALLVASVAGYTGQALCLVADGAWRWVDVR